MSSKGPNIAHLCVLFVWMAPTCDFSYYLQTLDRYLKTLFLLYICTPIKTIVI